MAEPKIPPEIARKIAQMNKAAAPAPAAKPIPAPASRPPAPAPDSKLFGGLAAKLAVVGWLTAALAIAAAFGIHRWAAADRTAALAAQAAAYEARLAQANAAADAALKKAQADAEASQQILKAELDFEKQPPLPLKLILRKGGVLYVENERSEAFACTFRLTRGDTTREFSFTLNGRAFRDLGAIDDWVFASGDRIEILKPGHKPWTGTFP